MPSRPVMILFANLKGNVGDLAILHAMLVYLEKHYPGIPRHVYSHGHKAVDQARMKCFLKQPHPAFEYQGPTPYRKIARRWSFLKYLGLHQWFKGKLVDRLGARFAKMEPFRSAGGYQAVFLAGGEQWGGFSAGINMFAIVDAVYRFNQNIFIFPFSVRKNVLDGYSLDMMRSCFAKISGKLVVRDSLSGETMRKITSRPVDGADCVFSLAAWAPAGPPADRQGNQAILTIAATDAEGSRSGDLAKTITCLAEAGIVVRLLTTCEEEDGDRLSELSRDLGIEFIRPATWQEVVEEFRRSTLVVTNRLHCMILAFFADVPVVPLVNREKVHGVCVDAGLDHSIGHLAELTPRKVFEYTECGEEIRRTMRQYLEKTEALQADIQGR